MLVRTALGASLLLLAACGDKDGAEPTTSTTTGAPDVDDDLDGWTELEGDCEDDDFDVNPGADERCDGIDNDCDGLVDEADVVDGATFYVDDDGDGFGNPARPVEACEAGGGLVDDATDCDDLDPQINRTAVEVCDPFDVDEDCDGVADDADLSVDADSQGTWYLDADGDGYGEDDITKAVSTCEPLEGYASNALDCDDQDAAVNPELLWYADTDGDGFGDRAASVAACTRPSGFVADDTDCDDRDASSSPDSVRYRDADGDGYGDPDQDLAVVSCTVPSGYSALSTDCDDANSSLNPDTPWYADADGDGYGDAGSAVLQCTQPTGYLADTSDCDDTDSSLNPDTVWYADTDGDGYGDPSNTTAQCTQPTGYLTDDSDCDDADASLNPDTIWYADADGDGYGDAAATTVQCAQPSGHVDDASDCDDADAGLNPDTPWYADRDGDGYGDPGNITRQCTQPSGHLADDSDCDDTDAALNPETVWYADVDGDGYGDAASTTVQCPQPSAYVSDDTDCDDGDGDTWPGASETCYDGVVNDCEGTESDAIAACPSAWAGSYGSGRALLTLDGSSEADHLDAALVADLDGDGVDDLVSASSMAGSGDGAVYLFAGPLTGDADFSEAGVLSSSESGAQIGAALAVGDRDGDGYNDLIVGGPRYGSEETGVVFMLYGPITQGQLESIADRTLTSQSLNGQISGSYGTGAAFMPDQTGDGDLEVVLGDATYGSNDRGIFYGLSAVSSGTLGGSTYHTLDGRRTNDQVGAGESFVGDVDLDGDGVEEFIVGVPLYDDDGTDDGAVFTILGPMSSAWDLVDSSATFTDSDGGDGAWLGHLVLSPGDMDGDGYDDLLLGSPYADMGATSGGRVAVMAGGSLTDQDVATDALVTIDGSSAGAILGGTAEAADLDGDGNVDLILGSGAHRFADGGNLDQAGADAVWVFYGPLSGSLFDTDADAELTGDPGFGMGLGVLEDVGSDGYDELIIGVSGGAGSDSWLLFESASY